MIPNLSFIQERQWNHRFNPKIYTCLKTIILQSVILSSTLQQQGLH